MYSFLSLLLATFACRALLPLAVQAFRKYLNRKGKSQFLRGLSEGGGDPGFKMVCLPISPLPQTLPLQRLARQAGEGLMLVAGLALTRVLAARRLSILSCREPGCNGRRQTVMRGFAHSSSRSLTTSPSRFPGPAHSLGKKIMFRIARGSFGDL